MPSSLTYANAPVATATYDPCLWTLSNLSGSGWISSFNYDLDQARLHSLFHGNGSQNVTWTYHYDSSNRLQSADEQLSTPLSGDATGGSLKVTDQFGYDRLNRLVSAQVWNLDHTVQAVQSIGTVQKPGYDGFGNAFTIQTTAGPGTLPDPTKVPWCNLNNFTLTNVEITTQAQTNRLPTTASGISTGAAYDGQGNLTTIWAVTGNTGTGKTLTYDALGRVTQMFDATANRNVTEVYAYSAEGLRTLVESWQGSTLLSRTFNLYNDGRQLVCQYAETLSGGTTGSAMAMTKASAKTAGIKPLVVYKEPCGAYISAPTSAQVGQSVLFSGSTDFGTAATWAFGDGGTASGFSPSHTYGATGTYTVK
jgi:hypothetical protein